MAKKITKKQVLNYCVDNALALKDLEQRFDAFLKVIDTNNRFIDGIRHILKIQ